MWPLSVLSPRHTVAWYTCGPQHSLTTGPLPLNSDNLTIFHFRWWPDIKYEVTMPWSLEALEKFASSLPVLWPGLWSKYNIDCILVTKISAQFVYSPQHQSDSFIRSDVFIIFFCRKSSECEKLEISSDALKSLPDQNMRVLLSKNHH